MHLFATHATTTVMPTHVAYPGLVDPGVGVVLPIVYASLQGLIHLVCALALHQSGTTARGSNTNLEIVVEGQPTFSVTY